MSMYYLLLYLHQRFFLPLVEHTFQQHTSILILNIALLHSVTNMRKNDKKHIICACVFVRKLLISGESYEDFKGFKGFKDH